MADDEFLFEAQPFEMTGELETRWPRGGIPPGRTSGSRPSPSWNRPRRRRVAPVYLGPSDLPGRRSLCEVLLVLEGYSPSSPRLAAHHEPMLQRLAARL